MNLTIPAAHVEVSAAAIAAGKSVYSEKPLGLDRVGAASLVTGAKDAGVRLGCAPDTFMGAGLQTVRALIDDGAIGRPLTATAFMMSPGPESWHPRPQIFYATGGGPTFDIGPYYITALVSLLGPVKRVTALSKAAQSDARSAVDRTRARPVPVEVPTHVAGSARTRRRRRRDDDLQLRRSAHARSLDRDPRHRGDARRPGPEHFGGRVRLCKAGRDVDWTDLPVERPHKEQSRGSGSPT